MTDILLDTLQFGLPYSVLALAVFISYRLLDFADMTCEGSFVCGGAMCVAMIKIGVNPIVATLMAVACGLIAGFITGILHTKLKINGLLAGIITMTGLFSINMCVFAFGDNTFNMWENFKSFCTLDIDYEDPTIFGYISNYMDVRKYGLILTLLIVVPLVASIIYFFFGTEVGMSMRATGMNAKMARTQGINTTAMIILGLMISNALIALSSALCAQRDFTMSYTSGTGMLVIGLASIIIGEAVFGKRSFLNWMISVMLGAVVYYFIIAIALYMGFPSHLLKLLYAIIIAAILGISYVYSKFHLPSLWSVIFKIKKNKSYDLSEIVDDVLIDESKMGKASVDVSTNEFANESKMSKHNPKIKYTLKLNKLNEELEILNTKKASGASVDDKIQEIENQIAETQKLLDEHNAKLESTGVLSVKNVTMRFNPTGNPQDVKVALNDLSVDIHEGEFVTIIGGNGSGKSTFFNTCSGVYTPTSGNIYINGMDVTKLPEHKRAYYIGRVAQDPYQGTAHDMSIMENMSLAMRRNQGKSLKWGFNRKHNQLFKNRLSTLGLGLENRMSAKIGTLSGGQRQAVTLLMATLQRPDVLFLDEHTAALDPKTARIVLELTDKIIAENNLTAVMVTHNMKDAIKYGNRLLMFNKGKIIYDVSGEEKQNLTVEQLLNKFENVEFSDKDILG